MSEEPNAVIVEVPDDLATQLLLLGCNIDIVTPMFQMLYEAGGMIPCYGTVDELKKLQAKGITCHAPMVDTMSGGAMYVWLLTESDYRRAERMLGGGR